LSRKLREAVRRPAFARPGAGWRQHREWLRGFDRAGKLGIRWCVKAHIRNGRRSRGGGDRQHAIDHVQVMIYANSIGVREPRKFGSGSVAESSWRSARECEDAASEQSLAIDHQVVLRRRDCSKEFDKRSAAGWRPPALHRCTREGQHAGEVRMRPDRINERVSNQPIYARGWVSSAQ
jgi:hypothetical protein